MDILFNSEGTPLSLAPLPPQPPLVLSKVRGFLLYKFAVRKTSKSVTDRKEAVFISKTAPFCIENGFFFICNSFSNLKTQYTNDTKTRRFHNPRLRAHGACRDVSAASFAQPRVAQAARMDSCCTWTGAAASPAWLPPEPAHVATKASRRDCRGAGRAVRATAAQK